MQFDRLRFDARRKARKFVQWLLGRGKIFRTVALCFAGLLMVVFVLGFVPFSSPILKQKVETIIKESFAESCSIEKLTITLWAGVTVKKVQCAWRDPTGVFYTCLIPEAGISYHALPLIFKQLIIKNITLEQPRFMCKLPAQPLGADKPRGPFSIDKFTDALAGFPYRVLISNITLSKARLSVTQERSVIMDCKGVGLSMKVGFDRGLTLKGSCGADSVALIDAWHATDLRAGITINGPRIALNDCKADCYGGRVSFKAAADLSRSLLENASIAAAHIKLDRWYADEKAGPGRLSGKLDMSMTFEQSALDLDSLKARGTAAITNVAANDLPIQKNLLVNLAVPKLATMHFSKISSDLQLGKGKIYNEKTRGEGDPMDFAAAGRVDMKGYFSERINAEFSGDFMRTLPPFVQKSLLPVEGDPDKRAFNCSASGTFKNPHVSVDQRIVDRAVGNVIDEIGKGLGRLFGK